MAEFRYGYDKVTRVESVLQQEVVSNGISGFLNICGSSGRVELVFDRALSTAEQTKMGVLVVAHNAIPISGTVFIASGSIGTRHLSSGTVVDHAGSVKHLFQTAEAISGIKAVCLCVSGFSIVRAERQSGFRLPAIGVSITNGASGDFVYVVTQGYVLDGSSGTIASGFHGHSLYVGSGGHIVNKSGFMGGASSGPGWGMFSGSYNQKIGISVSGGIWVLPNNIITLTTVSGQQNRTASGQYPISGINFF